MRSIPPFDDQTVRCLMFGLVPTIHRSYADMFATQEYLPQVLAFSEFLQMKREIWMTLPDDSEILHDLLQIWQTLQATQMVALACTLRLMHSLLHQPEFPWPAYDARPLPAGKLIHMDHESVPTKLAWMTYLELKSMLRDPSVISEIAITWDSTAESAGKSSNLRLIQCLGYSSSPAAVELLFDRWGDCLRDDERRAAQLELCLLRQPGVLPPPMTDLEIERSELALLVHSIRLHTPHPVLLRYLQTDNSCYEFLRTICLRRPHLRQLCQGPGTWSENLIRYLATPHYDLPPSLAK